MKRYTSGAPILGVIMSSITIDDILDNIDFGSSWFEIRIPNCDINLTIYPLAWRYIYSVQYKEAGLYFSDRDRVKKFINAVANNNMDVILFSQLISYMDMRTRYKLSDLLTEREFGEEQMERIIKSKYLSMIIRLRTYYTTDSIKEHIRFIGHLVRRILQRHYNNEYIRKYCKKIINFSDEERLEAYIISQHMK